MAWEDDRDGSTGYVTVTTLNSAVDEAIPFVYVKLSDLPADFHTAMSDASDTDGKTIRVSTSDGATQLPCRPEGVDIGTDTGALFFLGTGMSASGDVDYRIYVGNVALSMPSAGGGMGEQAVFASYVGAYMPGVATRDFTSGGRTLTAVGTPGTATGSMEGVLAATYNGSSSYHKYEGTQAVSGWPLHIDASIYTSSLTSNRTAVGLSLAASATNYVTLVKLSDNMLLGSVIGNGGSGASPATATMISATHYYGAVNRDSDSGDTRAYFSGTQYTSATNVNTPTAFNRFSIGAQMYNSSVSLFWSGGVTIVLLSNSVRSANYVTTMVDNLGGALYSVGTWTALGGGNETAWVEYTEITQSAGTGEVGTATWTDLSNMLTNTGTAATASVVDGEYSYRVFLSNVNGALDEIIGQTITGISWEVIGSGEDGTNQRIFDAVNSMKLIIGGSIVGTSIAATSLQWHDASTETRIYGDDAELLGLTPTGAELAADDAGVTLQFYSEGETTAAVGVNRVRVKVYYGEAAAEEELGSFFKAFATFGSVV